MTRKKMEDVKFKGVRITNISRKDIDINYKPSEHIETVSQQVNQNTNHIHERVVDRKLPSTPMVARKSKALRKSILITFLLFILLGGIYWYGYTFQNAKIIITEKNKPLTLDQELWSASKSSSSPIRFEIMIVSDEESKDFTLTQSQVASTKAKGIIILYNEYSTKPQIIASGSFVADTAGKTYKTDKTVTIPGYKMIKNVITPGQVEVGITAFLTGDSYNGNPTDFYINAFKNSPKYKKIYGKGKSGLSGGAEGLIFTFGTEDKGKLDAYASSSVKNNLLRKISAQVPEGYILYPNAVTYTYNMADNISSSTPNTSVKINGTLSALLLNEKDLSLAVIKKLLPEVSKKEQSEIEVQGLDKLALSFVSKEQTITKDIDSIQFKLKGNLNAIWHPNIEIIKSSLVGLSKSEVTSVFKLEPGILDAKVNLFPMWQSYLPQSLDKISIQIK